MTVIDIDDSRLAHTHTCASAAVSLSGNSPFVSILAESKSSGCQYGEMHSLGGQGQSKQIIRCTVKEGDVTLQIRAKVTDSFNYCSFQLRRVCVCARRLELLSHLMSLEEVSFTAFT